MDGFQRMGRQWVGGLAVAVGGCVGCGGSVVGCVFCFLFLYFSFGGCDSSGCGLIFMGCDGLMLVGGGSCRLILVVLFFLYFLVVVAATIFLVVFYFYFL